MEETAPVIVGVDGSAAGRAALRWALAEAEAHGRPLEVVHAWREPRMLIPPEYDAALVEAGRMDQAALGLIDRELDVVGADQPAAVEVRRRAIDASAGRGLAAASRKAAMVVVGRGAERHFLGPRAVQVAHHAKVPVAVVPSSWEGAGSGVVVGIDGSRHSAKALRWALDEARVRKARTTALLAWSYLNQYDAEGSAPFDPAYDATTAHTAAEKMVAEALEGREIGEDLDVVAVNELAARALMSIAQKAELLVVGARGLGGFRELLLGSVSHTCLAESPVPTVVVR